MGTEWPTDVVAKQIADVVVAKNIEIVGVEHYRTTGLSLPIN